jgi:hypothetical protein
VQRQPEAVSGGGSGEIRSQPGKVRAGEERILSWTLVGYSHVHGIMAGDVFPGDLERGGFGLLGSVLVLWSRFQMSACFYLQRRVCIRRYLQRVISSCVSRPVSLVSGVVEFLEGGGQDGVAAVGDIPRAHSDPYQNIDHLLIWII